MVSLPPKSPSLILLIAPTRLFLELEGSKAIRSFHLHCYLAALPNAGLELHYSQTALLSNPEVFPKAVEPGVRCVYSPGLLHSSLAGAGRLAWILSVL